MRVPLVATAVLASMTASTMAMNARMVTALKKMDPQTRLEQRCDIEAMDRILADTHRFSPDKVLAYAFGDPEMDKDSMVAEGAAFRSQGVWRRLAYSCRTDSDHLEVVSFDYTIGKKVPRSKWAKHYLVP